MDATDHGTIDLGSQETPLDGPTAEEIATVRAGGWEPSYDSEGRVIAWGATALTLMAEAAGARGEDVTYVSERGDIAVSSRDAARAARVKKSIMVRSVRAVSATSLRVARPRESHARPRARARRTAARRASGPRSGQDPGDDDGESEPAGDLAPLADRRRTPGGRP